MSGSGNIREMREKEGVIGDMKECIVYAKDRKCLIGEAFGSMFLLGISGVIMLPYLMRQWSYDRRIGPIHLILGGVCLCGGVLLLYLLLRKLIPGRRSLWKSSVWFIGSAYLAVQLVLSCIMGGIGWGIAKTGILDFEQIKWIIYLLAGFCQNVIRVSFIYLLMERFYERNWKKDIFTGKRAIAVLLGLCVIMTLPALLPEGNLQNGSTLLCQCVFLTGLMIYFGNYAWRRVTNEEKE